MFKMIIVEDEKMEREGLIEFYNWEDYGVQIVGSASDGISGIELAKKVYPDIIITDIKMPGMDGLEMSRRIKEFLPKVKVIILSGYNDFKYAKEAISFRASDYILKPIEDEEILSTIERVVNECRIEDNIKNRHLKEYNAAKEKFIIDFLEGKEAKSMKSASEYGIDLGLRALFSVCAIKVGKDSNDRLRYLLSKIDIDLENNILFSAVDEQRNAIYICLYNSKDGEDICNLYSKIDKFMAENSSVWVLGVGNPFEDINKISDSFNAAKQALKYGWFWGHRGIAYYSNIENILKNSTESTREYIISGNNFAKQLLHAVSASEEDKVNEILLDMFKFIEDNNCVDMQSVISLLNSIIYEAALLEYHLNKSVGSDRDYCREFMQLETFDEMKNYLREFLFNTIRKLNEKRNNKDEGVVKNVIKIIEERYMKDISLKVLAAEVFLSPNYLGTIFKKFVGKSFNDYLTEYRMEKAKELLINSNKKIAKVAEDVGIPNTSYFCMVFKNSFGMSPKEYKEMILRE